MFFDFFTRGRKSKEVSKFGLKNEQILSKKIFNTITPYIENNSSILEIGPGFGTLAKLLVDAQYDYTGIEANEELRKKLVQEGIKVELGIAPPINFEDDSFDFVYSNAVIEHMPTFKHALEFIEECNRVLKRRGFIGIGFPDYIRCGIDFFNWDYTHSFVTTEKRVIDLLFDCGFSPVKTVRFSGSISFSPIRSAIDLVMLFVHNRPVYLLAQNFGLKKILHKAHKTFQSVTVILAEKL